MRGKQLERLFWRFRVEVMRAFHLSPRNHESARGGPREVVDEVRLVLCRNVLGHF